MKKRIIASVLICVLLLAALSACKRQEDETIDAAAIAAGSGTVAENGKTVVSTGKASGTSEPLAAEPDTQTQINITVEGTEKSAYYSAKKEEAEFTADDDKQESEPMPGAVPSKEEEALDYHLPTGLPYQTLCLNGSYCEGMEKYIPDSFTEFRKSKEGEITDCAREYVYSFNGSMLNEVDWDYEADKVTEYYDNRPDCSTYSAFMEAFGEDGLIVIGKAVGLREGHLAYFSNKYISASGFTLTGFSVDEVLYGSLPGDKITIREDYRLMNPYGKGNALCAQALFKFALPDGCRFLLFLKKTNAENTYSIYGGYGGIPVPDDYKKYDQEYLDRVAKFLNLDPLECDKSLAESLTSGEFYDVHRNDDKTGRDLKEALEANKDDLLVALAMKYKIRLWPYRSKGFEDANLPFTSMVGRACKPDYNSVLHEP